MILSPPLRRRLSAACLSTPLHPAPTLRRASSRLSIPTPPPFPVQDSCPAPTCPCRATPPGLDIDRDAPLHGTTAAYAEHILVSTGRSDWGSRIDEDADAELVRGLKALLGRGGEFSNPYHTVLVTNSSIPATPSPGTSPRPASAYLLPSFTYLPSIPPTPSSISTFLRAFVLPHSLHPSLSSLPPSTLPPLRNPSLRTAFPTARPAPTILVLICGHASRDSRCGVLGPLLQSEFSEQLSRAGVAVLTDPPGLEHEHPDGGVPAARVAQVSHVGGHKFAGNVIVYVPPGFEGNALAGAGVWYGRVEPRHVQGIVEATVLGGRVIRELFRGGIGRDGEVLRL